jgi:uncharacterized protein YjbJ (UPF0337 family)
MSGTADEMKGRAKEAAGDLTDDDSLKAKGKADKASGKAKSLVDDVKDKAEDAVDKVKAKLDRN